MTIADVSASIDLDIPPDFHQVPLDESVEDRVYGQTRILDLLQIEDRAQREGLGWYLEALSRSVGDGAVVSTAFCAVRLRGEPSTATLTVAVHPAASDDPLVFAMGATESLRRTGLYDSVSEDNLGRNVAAVARRVGTSSAHITYAVPVRGQHLSVVVSLSTVDTSNLTTYERIARNAASSIRLVDSRTSALGA